jgi:hypothetical protein
MARMKELYTEINDLLDNTYLLTEDIAKKLGCPIDFVNQAVQQRWNDQQEYAIEAYVEMRGA